MPLKLWKYLELRKKKEEQSRNIFWTDIVVSRRQNDIEVRFESILCLITIQVFLIIGIPNFTVQFSNFMSKGLYPLGIESEKANLVSIGWNTKHQETKQSLKCFEKKFVLEGFLNPSNEKAIGKILKLPPEESSTMPREMAKWVKPLLSNR